MRIETIICDKCGEKCGNTHFEVFRVTDWTTKGKSDICETCYSLMLDWFKTEKEVKNGRRKTRDIHN